MKLIKNWLANSVSQKLKVTGEKTFSSFLQLDD